MLAEFFFKFRLRTENPQVLYEYFAAFRFFDVDFGGFFFLQILIIWNR